ncbi:hypothetical protein FRX31_025623 [Thalictrum thalictroides]|uniref:Uncharacterized protein n=1 Tax=Thalictrum thalictroides TaxID=46969 RepID=A0A7J6VKZ1_THATH|nr:hypothetical protein FRX31_025623 [Thalictrum thalictroides]
MGLHLLALTKLKLFAAATYGTSSLITATVVVFLKIPFSTRDISRVCSNAFVASRLLLFRFGVIMFEDELLGTYNRRRWERAFRLFRERMTSGLITSEDHEDSDSLLAATMVAL